MTDTTDKTPDVYLPIGAIPPDDVARGWADYDNEFRIVYGPQHRLRSDVQPDGELWVEACATQMADGTIQSRNLAALETGPTVSIQCHWENYLTSDEAREVAHMIEKSADLVDKWSMSERHVCEFDWCTSQYRSDDEHWEICYYPASLRGGDPHQLSPGLAALKVGVGLVYEEGDVPAVIIHLDGGPYDYDHDAHMKVTEAIALRDALTEVIKHGRHAMNHWVEHRMDGVR